MANLTAPRILETGVLSGRAVLREPPGRWSYSSLNEVETCPLRYALSRADYPDLWNQRGYPRLPSAAAIQGDVVHGALEIIVKAIVKAGCSSTRSADAVPVLRELGGYTKVAENVLAAQLARFDGNPRLSLNPPMRVPVWAWRRTRMPLLGESGLLKERFEHRARDTS